MMVSEAHQNCLKEYQTIDARYQFQNVKKSRNIEA